MKAYRETNKIAFIILVIGIIALSIPRYVMADCGAKSSVDIHVKNLPREEYILGLLIEGGPRIKRSSNLLVSSCTVVENKMYGILYNYNQNGWKVRENLSGGSLDVYFSKENVDCFEFNNAPDTFKVIIVTETGKIHVSDEITKQQYFATCYYDVVSGKLTEQQPSSKISIPSLDGPAAKIVGAFLATLLIECVIMCFFGLQSAANLIRIIAANIVTQIFLNLYLLCIHVKLSTFGRYVPFCALIVVEVMITIAETLYYKNRLKYYSKIQPIRNVAYAVVANASSMIFGIYFAG